jgi:exosome complex component RRP40
VYIYIVSRLRFDHDPTFEVGTLVYARVSLAHKDMEPELECVDAQTRKASGFGDLKGGFLVRCSLKMSRLCAFYLFPRDLFRISICSRLLDPKHFLLPCIGARFPFEAAIGMNGRVWMNTKVVKQTIAISRCIEAVDPDGGNMNEAELIKFLNTIDA